MSFGKIDGSADIKGAGDYLLEAAALPASTSSDSNERKINDGEAGVEIVGVAYTDIASGALTMTLYDQDTSSVDTTTTGSSTEMFSQTAGSFSAGDEIFRFIPPQDTGMFGVLKTTTTADKSAEKVSVYVTPIANR